MGELCERMRGDLKIAGFSPSTSKICLMYARHFARFHMRSPAQLGRDVGLLFGDRVEVRAFEPPRGDLGHADVLRGQEARVDGDHLTGAAGDDGLLPFEPAEGSGNVGDRGVVLTRVGRGTEERVDRYHLDRRRRRLRHRDSHAKGLPAAWRKVYESGMCAKDLSVGKRWLIAGMLLLLGVLALTLIAPSETRAVDSSDYTDTLERMHALRYEFIMRSLDSGNHMEIGPLDIGRAVIDSWGTELVAHVLVGGEIQISSAGPDREWGTADDIIRLR